MAEVKTVKASAGQAVINEILESDGCVVIEDVLDERQVQKLAAELAPHFDEAPNCPGDFYGYVTKRLSGLIAKSRACQSMAIHPSILGVMDHFLLKGCRGYHLNLTQAIQIGPGEPAQVIHRDDLMFNFAHPEFEAMINAMWAVDDFTAENGATHVVPGQPQVAARPAGSAGRGNAGRHEARIGADISRIAASRRRREPDGPAAYRHRAQLFTGLAAAGRASISCRAF